MRNNLYICNAKPQTKTTLTSHISGSNFETHYTSFLMILSIGVSNTVIKLTSIAMGEKVTKTLFVLLLLALQAASCNSSPTKKDDTNEVQTENAKDTVADVIALINQSYNISDMESKLAEMHLASEDLASEACEEYCEQFIIGDWLYGTWEYSGYDEWVGRYTMYVSISENELRWGYNGQESYKGPYEIDMNSLKIYYDRHNGFSTYINFNPEAERISDGEGHYFKKVNRSVGASYSSSYSGSSFSSSNQSNVQFRTDSDVISYTSSHSFRNNAGNSIKINFQGMYINGSLVTNAPRVLSFSGSTATISVSSPYTGGGAMIIRVDASNGTIIDGSGDVFRMVN